MTLRGCVQCRYTVDDYGDGHHAPDCPTRQPRPELGSGALREALETINKLCEAISRIRWARGTDKLNDEINYAIKVQCKAEAALSLSSPIEPPAEGLRDKAAEALFAYDAKKLDTEDFLNEVEKIYGVKWTAQASSEIREALEAVKRELGEKCIDGVPMYDWLSVGTIQKVDNALAPSRQGAAKRVEG